MATPIAGDGAAEKTSADTSADNKLAGSPRADTTDNRQTLQETDISKLALSDVTPPPASAGHMDTASDSHASGLGLQTLQSRLTPEDRQTVLHLYQTCPRLWGDFRQIVNFMDLVGEDKDAYSRLSQSLFVIASMNEKYPFSDFTQVTRFAQAVGFSEVCVELYRHILKAKGLSYVSESHFPPADTDMMCVWILRNILIGFSYHGPEFRLRLAKTGIAQEMLEDLRHVQYLTADALANGHIHYSSVAVIHNCCMNPEALPYVRSTPGIVQTFAAFLDKEHNRVRGPSLVTLSHILEDSDLDLIKLDPELLRYFTECGQKAFGITQGIFNSDFGTDAVVYGLSHLARNVCNRRLIVAHGDPMRLLLRVLEGGREDEKELAIAAVTELAQDPTNAQLFQRDRVLQAVLQKLRSHENQDIKDGASKLLCFLEGCRPDDDCDRLSGAMADLLEENENELSILGVGHVEYVLDKLRVDNIARGGCQAGQPGNQEREPLLKALAHLARNDSRKREIFARGGLDVLAPYLQKGTDGQIQDALNVLRGLASSVEYCSIMQSNRGLTEALGELSQSDNLTVSRMAESIGHSIKDSDTGTQKASLASPNA